MTVLDFNCVGNSMLLIDCVRLNFHQSHTDHTRRSINGHGIALICLLLDPKKSGDMWYRTHTVGIIWERECWSTSSVNHCIPIIWNTTQLYSYLSCWWSQTQVQLQNDLWSLNHHDWWTAFMFIDLYSKLAYRIMKYPLKCTPAENATTNNDRGRL